MKNPGLDEAQAGIKIAGRNINNLRYADDTTLMAESEEELECLDESERGEWKVGLKLNIQKTKLLASGPITSWQIDGKQWKHERLYFSGLQNHCRWWLQSGNEKTLDPWKKSYDQPAAAATAAKSLQSCPTLCDPIDGNPPGSPVPGILQAKTLEWVTISFSNAWKWKVKVKLLNRAWL